MESCFPSQGTAGVSHDEEDGLDHGLWIWKIHRDDGQMTSTRLRWKGEDDHCACRHAAVKRVHANEETKEL